MLHVRRRLLPATLLCLATGILSGKSLPDARTASTSILDRRQLQAGDSLIVRFAVPQLAVGESLRLALDARLEATSFAGSAPALRILVNGHAVDESRLADKPLVFAMANRMLLTWADGDRWRVLYSPDFDPKRNAPGVEHRVLGTSPYHLELRIDDLVHPGDNELAFYHIGHGLPPLDIADVHLEIHRTAETGTPGPASKPTPAKPSPRSMPGTASSEIPQGTTGFQSMSRNGAIEILIGGEQVPLETEISIPGGGWRRLGDRSSNWDRLDVRPTELVAESSDLRLRRRVVRTNPFLEVEDTITNRTRADLGLLVRYAARLPNGTTYLGGLPLPPEPIEISRYEPMAPSAVSVQANGCLGLLPGNDVLWVHAETYRDSTGFGLLDGNLCMGPGASVRLVWRAFATTASRFEDWVNVVRPVLGANFTLEGGFAFGNFTMNDWPEEKLRTWIRTRGLHFISSPAPTSSASHGLHGPALLDSPQALASMQRFAQAVHRAAPEVKVLSYFHSSITNRASAAERYATARIRSVSGAPEFYPYPSQPTSFPLFASLPGSSYAKDLEVLIAKLLEIGFDGLYWDEASYSVSVWGYGLPWDGVSGDVDRTSMRLIRRKSAVPLLVQPWVEAQVRALMQGGHALVANTEPVTVTMQDFHFPRFVETSNSIQLLATLLWSPIGLGDRSREHTPADVAARIRAHLDSGALYYFYMPYISMSGPDLATYMYPSTPRELHAGTIVAEERILTTRSGRYGWGDASRHLVHVFDAGGNEVTSGASSVSSNGVTWTELALPRGSAAVIVRQRP